jgi:hypothetical protein
MNDTIQRVIMLVIVYSAFGVMIHYIYPGSTIKGIRKARHKVRSFWSESLKQDERR